MQAAPLITEELLDEDFFAELDALIDEDFEENKEIQEENRNCGTGAIGGKQGFQPGNKCAGDGSKSKAKAEGKKKDVHSDWISKDPIYWEEFKDDNSDPNSLMNYESMFHSDSGDITVYGTPNFYSRDNAYKYGGEEPGKDDGVFKFNFSKEGYGYAASNTGDALSTMRKVMHRAVDLYNKPDVDALEFAASNKDKGRVRTYAYLTKWAQKRFPEAKAYYKEVEGGMHIFVIANKKAQDGYLEWDYKNSPNPYWEFEHQDQFTGVDGRSAKDKKEKFLIPESILTKEFFEELGRLLDEDYEAYNSRSVDSRNCGTGSVGGKQGFQPGNKCAGDGSKSKAKAEGKKKEFDPGSYPSPTWSPNASSGNNSDSANAVTKKAELAQDAYFEAVEGLHPVRTSPVTIDSYDLMNKSTGGMYSVEENQILLNEGYFFRPNHILREEKINIEDAKGLDDVAMAGRRGELVDTIAHEWGHVFDYQGYGSFDEPGRYSGKKAFRDKLYATDTYKMMDNIMNQKPLSEVDGLEVFKSDRKAKDTHMERKMNFNMFDVEQRDRLQAYWNSPREHFARAYSQYVVKNAKIKPGSPNEKSFKEARELRTKRQRDGLNKKLLFSTEFTDEEIDSFGDFFEKDLAGGK